MHAHTHTHTEFVSDISILTMRCNKSIGRNPIWSINDGSLFLWDSEKTVVGTGQGDAAQNESAGLRFEIQTAIADTAGSSRTGNDPEANTSTIAGVNVDRKTLLNGEGLRHEFRLSVDRGPSGGKSDLDEKKLVGGHLRPVLVLRFRPPTAIDMAFVRHLFADQRIGRTGVAVGKVYVPPLILDSKGVIAIGASTKITNNGTLLYAYGCPCCREWFFLLCSHSKLTFCYTMSRHDRWKYQ